MKKIKFSHKYDKLCALGNYSMATLLQCFEVDIKDLSPYLLAEDTIYSEIEEGIVRRKEYKLPKSGKFLLLLFRGVNGMFTTIRRAYPNKKVDYYKNAVGEQFEVVVNPSTFSF